MDDALSEDLEYGNILVRFCAYLLDAVIANFISLVIGLIFGFLLSYALSIDGSLSRGDRYIVDGSIYLPMLLVYWLYFALLESSSRQATFGKAVLGLKVVDYEGSKISFGLATGRLIIKSIPFAFAASAAVILLDKKNQAIHDAAAETYVVKSK